MYQLISINADASNPTGYRVTYSPGQGEQPRDVQVSYEIGKLLFAAIERGKKQTRNAIKEALDL
jgi:hypothetical protein